MLNSPLGGRRGIGFGLGRSWQRGGFLPTDIAGLQLWLDFSDASTLFVDAGVTNVSADGDAIYQANDKSGEGHHVAQATTASRPLYKTGIKNGLSASLFNGSYICLVVPPLGLSNKFTVFGVSKKIDTTGGFPFIFSIRDGGNPYLYLSIENVVPYVPKFYYRDISGKFVEAVGTTIISEHSLLCGVGNGDDNYLYLNGNIEATGTNSAYDENQTYNKSGRIGALDIINQGFIGYIDEVIVYNGALSDTNRQSVESYLNNKWTIY